MKNSRQVRTVITPLTPYAVPKLNQYTQRTVPGYAGVRGSATNSATVTVNGNSAWRLGEYFYGGDEANNAASAVMKELDITAVVNPSGTNEADLVQSVTGKVFVAKSPEAFTHDDDGNMLSDGRFTYTWDGENRLVSIETSEAGVSAGAARVRVEYQYDNRSRRIGKVVSHFENDTWTVAESRAFVYDGWNMVQEFSTLNSQFSILNSYVWGLDLSGSLQGAGGVGGLLAVVRDGTAYHPTFDGNGNVCEYSSTDGSLAAHYEYSPFGETVVQSGDMANAFAFRFSTKYWENEAKLYYYGYRFYAPESGRWLNRDRLGERGGINRYVFCDNSCLQLIDLLGKASMGWGGSAGSSLDAVSSLYANSASSLMDNDGDINVAGVDIPVVPSDMFDSDWDWVYAIDDTTAVVISGTLVFATFDFTFTKGCTYFCSSLSSDLLGGSIGVSVGDASVPVDFTIGHSSHLGYTSSIDLGSHGANYGLGIPVVEVGVSVSVRLIWLAFLGKDDNGCPCEDSKPVTVVGLLSN